MFDWKLPAKATAECAANICGAGVVIYPDGTAQVAMALIEKVTASERAAVKDVKKGTWNRTVLTYDGKIVSATVNGQPAGTVKVAKAPPAGPVLFHSADGLELRNLFVREIQEKK